MRLRRFDARRALLLSTAGFLALMASPTMAGDIVGSITDGSGQQGLAGARVTILELGRRAEAGADGGFRITDVPAGEYTLSIDYVGADPVQQKVMVSETGTVAANIRLGELDVDLVDSVLVVGLAANQSGALSRQRSGDGIESVLTRDAIGQFPDQNVAEALRRVPGVNVLNDQGEGRFVAVRSLDPELNAASINGARVPAPESDVRSVALDVIPSELIESIEIKKSLTPDMDGDTIGASIEITTVSSLDQRKPFVSLSAEGSFNEATESWSPKASLDFSTRVGDLGIAGGLSYYRRRFATDNIEFEGWDVDGGIGYADTAEYRDYDVERTRIGYSLSLDYQLNADTTLFARVLHSDFADQEYRGRLTFEMDEAPSSGTDRSANFLSNDGEIVVIRDMKDRYETQSITSLVFGGESYFGAWELDYQLTWSRAEEEEDGSVDPIKFERAFEDPGELDVSFDYGNWRKPRYSVAPGDLALFKDPGEYEFDEIEFTDKSLAEDEETVFQIDATRTFALAQGEFKLKFGAKGRTREKTYDLEIDIYDGFSPDLFLSDFLGRQTYALADISPVPNRGGARRFLNQNRADFDYNDIDSEFESAVADFYVGEDVLAGYIMGRYESGRLKIVGGVRVEQTKNDIRGNLVELVEEDGTYNGVVLTEDTVFVTPQRFSKDYTHLLPSVAVTFEAAPDLLIRGAAFRSVVRPKIGKLAPRFLIEQDDNDEREGEFGNPALKPYDAWNYDFSVEWYFGKNAVLQGGVFYKTVKDYIVDAQFDDITFNGVFADEAIIPINGDEATVLGFEFNYQQAMTFLPGPFDGLLLGFNYTYTDAEGDVLGRTISLPASAETTYNATVGYEKGPVSMRLSASYRSEYLDELGGDAEEDRWVEEHLQWDFSAKYRITDKATVFLDLVNINDEPYVAYQKGPVRKRLLQYEEYGFTAKTGFKLRF